MPRRRGAFYRTFIKEVVPVSSPTVAELAKLHENIFRTVNIALANELALMCDRPKIDVWEVIDAAATKPFGFMPFYPGPGVGGHCLPINPHYLAWRARRDRISTRFIELPTHINDSMTGHVVSKVVAGLNSLGKPVRHSRVLILGVAYKNGVADTRESPALRIATRLRELDASLAYHDPCVPEIELGGERLRSVPILPDNLRRFDIAVILTDHDGVDYDVVQDNTPLIVDTRHAIKKARYPDRLVSI